MEEQKIIIVDDETNLLRSMEKTLLREGFDVETAGGNQEALEVLQASGPFDLAIVDLNMPDFEGQEAKYAGLELLDYFKENYPTMPVLVNSAWDEVETAKMCITRGAAGYFVKGRAEEMMSKIKEALQLK